MEFAPPRRSKRSSRANRYYFGVVIKTIALTAGNDRSDYYALHDSIAFKFLRISDCPITGSPRRMRTPDTDSSQFSTYVQQVKIWAMEFWPGLTFPDDEQATYDDLDDYPDARTIDREHGWGVVEKVAA